jgi:hypothetical protein
LVTTLRVPTMQSPGKVTEESKITPVLKEMVLREKPGTTDPNAWNLEMTSFIHERPDIDKFPWEAAADIDFSKLNYVYLVENTRFKELDSLYIQSDLTNEY